MLVAIHNLSVQDLINAINHVLSQNVIKVKKKKKNLAHWELILDWLLSWQDEAIKRLLLLETLSFMSIQMNLCMPRPLICEEINTKFFFLQAGIKQHVLGSLTIMCAFQFSPRSVWIHRDWVHVFVSTAGTFPRVGALRGLYFFALHSSWIFIRSHSHIKTLRPSFKPFVWYFGPTT